MKPPITSIEELDYDKTYLVPLGGQSEIGAVINLLINKGKILIIDSGACYPKQNLPGVDLLFPNTSFLENNQTAICGMVLSNCQESNIGSIFYLLQHIKIPKIVAPKFIINFLYEYNYKNFNDEILISNFNTEIIEDEYYLDPFKINWLSLFYPDEFMIKIENELNIILYTSIFKISQSPNIPQKINFSNLSKLKNAQKNVVLMSSSAGIENVGYSHDELNLFNHYNNILAQNHDHNRIIIVTNQLNISRIHLINNLINKFSLKLFVFSDFLVSYFNCYNKLYPKIQFESLSELQCNPSTQKLIVISSDQGNAYSALNDYANDSLINLSPQKDDIVIFNSEITLGQKRIMAKIADKLLSLGVNLYQEPDYNVFTSEYASQEDLKFILNLINPNAFIPIIGEYRHIYQHINLAKANLPNTTVIAALNNGCVYDCNLGFVAEKTLQVESSLIYFSTKQGEKISTSSVKERRNLCYEGVVSVSLVVDKNKTIHSISVQEHASGIRFNPKWHDTINNIETIVNEKFKSINDINDMDLNHETELLRQDIIRSIKSQYFFKPYLQVLITVI